MGAPLATLKAKPRTHAERGRCTRRVGVGRSGPLWYTARRGPHFEDCRGCVWRL